MTTRTDLMNPLDGDKYRRGFALQLARGGLHAKEIQKALALDSEGLHRLLKGEKN